MTAKLLFAALGVTFGGAVIAGALSRALSRAVAVTTRLCSSVEPLRICEAMPQPVPPVRDDMPVTAAEYENVSPRLNRMLAML